MHICFLCDKVYAAAYLSHVTDKGGEKKQIAEGRPLFGSLGTWLIVNGDQEMLSLQGNWWKLGVLVQQLN